MPVGKSNPENPSSEEYRSLFNLKPTPRKPLLTLPNFLIALACAIFVRPFISDFAIIKENFVLEFALNSLAWVFVVALYRYITKSSLRRWWIISGAIINFLILYLSIGTVYVSNILDFFNMILIPRPFWNSNFSFYVPLAISILFMYLAIQAPLDKKIRVFIFLPISLFFFLPYTWFIVALTLWKIYGFAP